MPLPGMFLERAPGIDKDQEERIYTLLRPVKKCRATRTADKSDVNLIEDAMWS
jgi:hypothetical protein